MRPGRAPLRAPRGLPPPARALLQRVPGLLRGLLQQRARGLRLHQRRVRRAVLPPPRARVEHPPQGAQQRALPLLERPEPHPLRVERAQLPPQGRPEQLPPRVEQLLLQGVQLERHPQQEERCHQREELPVLPQPGEQHPRQAGQHPQPEVRLRPRVARLPLRGELHHQREELHHQRAGLHRRPGARRRPRGELRLRGARHRRVQARPPRARVQARAPRRAGAAAWAPWGAGARTPCARPRG